MAHKKTYCGACGTMHRSLYDRTRRQVRDLSSGRFAYYVGRRCRSASIKDIAEELRLDWDAVKELDKQYMRAQIKRAGTPGPLAIGIVLSDVHYATSLTDARVAGGADIALWVAGLAAGYRLSSD